MATLTTRVLPPEEWMKLDGTSAREVWPYLNPLNTRVIAVEAAGQVVGCLVMMRTVHAEFLWIEPTHQGKAGVLRGLLRAMRQIVREWQMPTILGAAVSDQMRTLLEKFGAVRLPGDHYVMKGSESCRQP